MRPLDPRLFPDRRALGALVGVSGVRAIVGAAVVVGQALLLAGAFAAVVDGSVQADALVRSALAVVGLGVLGVATDRLADRTARRMARTTAATLRRRYLAGVLDDHPRSPGEVAALATRGVDAVLPYVADFVPQLVAAVVVPVVLVAVVFVLDVPSGLVLAVVVPLVPVFLALAGRFTQVRAEASWAATERLSGHLHDVAVGLPTLKRFGRHRRQGATIARLDERARRATMAALRTAFLSAFVLELATTLSVALVAVPLGLRLVDGTVALASAFAVLLLAPEVLAPIRRVGAAYHTAAEGVAALEHLAVGPAPGSASLAAVAGVEPAWPGRRPVPADPTLAVIDLTVARPGRADSGPTGLSFEARPGEVVALVGENGAGKSTTLAVLRGALTPTRGRVRVGDRALDDVDLDAWRAAVAWVPQRPVLLDDTVRANLVLGLEPTAPAHDVGVAARAVGIDGLLDRRARSLSAGERQRVALARALLRVESGGARVALLDEPTANLDAAAEDAVVATVRRLADRGAVVVVVAHRPALAAAADRVVSVGAAVPDRVGEPVPAVSADAAGSVDAVVGVAAGPAVGVAATEPVRSRDAASNGRAVGDGRPPWGWLRAESRPVRWRLVGSVAAGAGATVAGLALVAVAAWLLARASQRPDVLSLSLAVVAVRALALGKAGLRYVDRLASHDTVLRLLGSMRVRVFDRLAVLTPGGLAGGRHGDVLTRLLGDLDEVQDLWLRALLPPLVAAVAGVALVAVVALVLPVAAVVLACAVLLGGVAVPALGAWWHRRSGAARAPAERVRTEEVVEIAEVAEEIAAAGAGRARLERVDRCDQQLAAVAHHEAAADDAVAVAMAAIRLVATGVLLVVAGGVAAEGALGVLLVPALVLLAWSLPDVLVALPDAARRMVEVPVVVARVTAVTDADDPVPDPVPPVPAPAGPLTVDLEGVVLRWPGAAEPVLHGADLHVPAGATVALLGPSGAGKSTLAAALVRFIPVEAGTLRLGGVDVTTLAGDDVRRLVGWCAQDTHLFDASVRDNLRIGRPAAGDDELVAVLDRVGLGGWLAALPRGLDTRVGVSGSAVSGGQAQRLALAQVLLADPPVVVLDEPTAHLDPASARQLMADLLGATGDRTTIVITHRTEGLGAADAVVHLVNGRLVEGRFADEPVAAPDPRLPRTDAWSTPTGRDQLVGGPVR